MRSARLTIRPSGRRFAARLSSGVWRQREIIVAGTVGNAFGYMSTFTGAALALWSAFLLFAAWVAPRLLASPALSPRMIGHHARTRKNHTIVAAWGLSFGVFLSLTLVEGFSIAKLGAGALSALFAIAVFRLWHPRRNA